MIVGSADRHTQFVHPMLYPIDDTMGREGGRVSRGDTFHSSDSHVIPYELQLH